MWGKLSHLLSYERANVVLCSLVLTDVQLNLKSRLNRHQMCLTVHFYVSVRASTSFQTFKWSEYFLPPQQWKQVCVAFLEDSWIRNKWEIKAAVMDPPGQWSWEKKLVKVVNIHIWINIYDSWCQWCIWLDRQQLLQIYAMLAYWINSAKSCGFDSQGTQTCKALWIKVFARCMHACT